MTISIMEHRTMDDADLRILRALQREPQLTMIELSERVGLSHTPCWRRLKRLEKDGIIIGRALLLDPVRLGYPATIFANVTLKAHDESVLTAFEEEVQHHPEIVECFSMTGSADYSLQILSKSILDYERFLKAILLHLPGVGSISSSFALKQIKRTTEVPL